jgi:hypothetical protein
MKLGDMHLTFKDVPKVVLYILGLVSMVLLNFSWISAVVQGLLIFCLIVWIVSIKLRRRTCQRVFKYLLIGALICIIVFAASEQYMFRTAGHPPTFNPSQPDITISRSTILDTSIVELMQGITNTSAFSLLSLEYPGENVLKCIELNTHSFGINGGYVIVRFHHSTTFDSSFSSYLGRPYEVHARPWNLVFPAYVQQQTVNESLQQIDDLGLKWFYDRTLEEHQNKTGSAPEITDIRVFITWNDYETYQGLTLSMSCFYENNESRPASFTSIFQPNGTLL